MSRKRETSPISFPLDFPRFTALQLAQFASRGKQSVLFAWLVAQEPRGNAWKVVERGFPMGDKNFLRAGRRRKKKAHLESKNGKTISTVLVAVHLPLFPLSSFFPSLEDPHA